MAAAGPPFRLMDLPQELQSEIFTVVVIETAGFYHEEPFPVNLGIRPWFLQSLEAIRLTSKAVNFLVFQALKALFASILVEIQPDKPLPLPLGPFRTSVQHVIAEYGSELIEQSVTSPLRLQYPALRTWTSMSYVNDVIQIHQHPLTSVEQIFRCLEKTYIASPSHAKDEANRAEAKNIRLVSAEKWLRFRHTFSSRDTGQVLDFSPDFSWTTDFAVRGQCSSFTTLQVQRTDTE